MDRVRDEPRQGVPGRVIFRTRIVITPESDVLIENLSARMLEVALELNPEDESIKKLLNISRGSEPDRE